MLPRDRELTPSLLSWFGLSLGGMFACFAVIAWWRFSAPGVALGLALLGGFVAAIYYLVPPFQQPIINAFFVITWPIAATVSTLLLATVYYLVVTPIGLILKLFGRDPLAKHPDPAADSYWTEYPESPETDHYFRQY